MKKFIAAAVITAVLLPAVPLFALFGEPDEDVEKAAQGQEVSDFANSVAVDAAKNADPVHEKAKLYYNRGDQLFKAGNYPEAVKYYYTAAKIDNKFLEAWKKTAFCYYQMKKHKYAYVYFKKVLSMSPDDKDAKEFMDYYQGFIEKSKNSKIKREMLDSVWRAAVAPGWGQMYNGQMIKGIFVSGGFLVSAGLCLYNVVDQRDKYNKYLQTNENQDLAYKKVQDASTSALIFGLAAGAIYAAGIVDAALNYNSPDAQTAVFISPQGTIGAMASMRW
jgi:tetratricopeptide (TPR) repeat protein